MPVSFREAGSASPAGSGLPGQFPGKGGFSGKRAARADPGQRGGVSVNLSKPPKGHFAGPKGHFSGFNSRGFLVLRDLRYHL